MADTTTAQASGKSLDGVRKPSVADIMRKSLEVILEIGTNPDPKWNADTRCDAMWDEARRAIEAAKGAA